MNRDYDVTKREMDILKILWNSEKPLTASEIARSDNRDISISTSQTGLRSLVKKGLVGVDGIVYSGTVLTRSYKALQTYDQYEVSKLVTSYQNIRDKEISAFSFVSALVESEKSREDAIRELDRLERFLQEKKQQLLQEQSNRENAE
jgi:predicted transcriptional regulator